MKTMRSILQKTLLPQTEPKTVDFIVVIGGCKAIEPTLSSEISCPICSGREYYTFLEKGKRTWFCANGNCATNSKENIKPPKFLKDPNARAIGWSQFCDENDLGDKFYPVNFHGIKQSQEKINYMKKYLEKPQGIILMQGSKGTGKTYAALGMCEFYTRFSTSCRFMTQKNLFHQWMQNRDQILNFEIRFKSPELLVIDDFGTGEISPAFMSFFMDLVNFREGFTNKGTIITTNLSPEQMISYCGDALADRISVGVLFEFKEVSRRAKICL